MPDFLTDPIYKKVFVGTTAIGGVSGALGCFAYLRRQSLMGDIVSHSSLLGVVAAFLLVHSLGLGDPKSVATIVPGALVAGTLAMLLASSITNRTRIKEDASMGVMLAVFFGTGTFLLRYAKESVGREASGLDGYVFGLAAALSNADLLMIAGLGVVSIATMLVFWKEFKLVTFDPVFARSIGLRTRILDPLLVLLLVIGIVIGIRAVGVILMIALLITPAASARQWTRHLGSMVTLAALFGAISGGLGSVLSTQLGVPPGPVIVLVVTAVFIVSILLAPGRGVVARLRSRKRRAAQLEPPTKGAAA